MKSSRCATGVQNQINNGQPIIEFQTLTISAPAGGIQVDKLVKFLAPHKFFMICSIQNNCADAMVALSLSPVGFNSGGGTQIVPTGGEQWLPLSNKANSAGRAEGRYVKFAVPVQQFFLTADHPSINPAGGTYLLTLMGTDDIEAIISERT